MGWVLTITRQPLNSRERLGTHCTGGWVDPGAGLDVCEKSRPHRDSVPEPSIPKPVAVPTELSRPILKYVDVIKYLCVTTFQHIYPF
jgi:hypothetical protein